MSQVNRKPCSSLDPYRAVVVDIEAELDTAVRLLTIKKLQSYERNLIDVIKAIRAASQATVIQCMRSRDAVLSHIREARDQLSLAIIQLDQKSERGKNSQFFKNIRSCRSHLEKALSYWPS